MIIPDKIVEPVITLKDQFFDLKGLSVYSSLGVGTLRDHIKSGSLSAFKVKGKILIKKSEFDQFIEKHRLNKKQDIGKMVDELFEAVKS